MIILRYLQWVVLLFVSVGYAEEPVNELRQLEQLANLQRQQGNEKIDVNALAAASRQQAQNIPDQEVVTADPQRNRAFDDLMDEMYPLSPEQILEMRDRHEDSKRAESTAFMSPPKPTITSELVKLSPGATPPVIRLAQGFVSTLVFLDSTGAPWPIQSYNIGDPQSFNLQWNRVDNVISIQSKALFRYGNLVVRLENLDTPVVVTLLPGQQHVDYRRELRVQGFGPKANPVTGDSYPDKENSVLLGVLDGVPPVGSVGIESTDSSVEAWAQGGRMFIRTRNKILSPAWMSSVRSADGMYAYEMNKTTTLLISRKGAVKTVNFKE